MYVASNLTLEEKVEIAGGRGRYYPLTHRELKLLLSDDSFSHDDIYGYLATTKEIVNIKSKSIHDKYVHDLAFAWISKSILSDFVFARRA